MSRGEFNFDLPPDASAEMTAIALLGKGLTDLTAAVADLADQHHRLRDQVDQAAGSRPGGGAPGPLRWDQLDRPAATGLWLWLIGWVGWLVDRYQLAEEIPPCWPQHPPMVEELTALCAYWHTAYNHEATAEAPLRWHEGFARTRARLRDWDEHTRCRNGTHTDRRIDLPWPDHWRTTALDIAEADLTGRPTPTATPPGGSEPR